MFSVPEIQDTPADRGAMAVITRETGHADFAETAAIDYLNFVWSYISRDLAGCDAARFAAVDAAVSEAGRRLTGNLAPFVRERLDELMVLLVDWRWVSWAAAEAAAGRDPYLASA